VAHDGGGLVVQGEVEADRDRRGGPVEVDVHRGRRAQGDPPDASRHVADGDDGVGRVEREGEGRQPAAHDARDVRLEVGRGVGGQLRDLAVGELVGDEQVQARPELVEGARDRPDRGRRAVVAVPDHGVEDDPDGRLGRGADRVGESGAGRVEPYRRRGRCPDQVEGHRRGHPQAQPARPEQDLRVDHRRDGPVGPDRQAAGHLHRDRLPADVRREREVGRQLQPAGGHGIPDREGVGDRPAGGGGRPVRDDDGGQGVEERDRGGEGVRARAQPGAGVGEQADGQDHVAGTRGGSRTEQAERRESGVEGGEPAVGGLGARPLREGLGHGCGHDDGAEPGQPGHVDARVETDRRHCGRARRPRLDGQAAASGPDGPGEASAADAVDEGTERGGGRHPGGARGEGQPPAAAARPRRG